ncbi:MAG: phosphonate C-P lyase system protein PhnH [Hyphomicrobiales bacterium]|nr:phosphonate C-P lyase system protein PhnH [Hyphomicrobiales bacterium]
MLSEANTLEGGFSDPVLDAQSVFRALMDAMARPGSIARIEASMMPPAPLEPAAGAVAGALIDADTPYWLDSALDGEKLRSWLAFHTGARPAASLSKAVFALVAVPASMPPFERFAQGTQEYPDRSATLVLQIEDFDGGAPLTFRGPGIKERVRIAPRGLPADFAEQWHANRKRFPCGVDLVLTAGDAFACLPRSARLIPAED